MRLALYILGIVAVALGASWVYFLTFPSDKLLLLFFAISASIGGAMLIESLRFRGPW